MASLLKGRLGVKDFVTTVLKSLKIKKLDGGGGGVQNNPDLRGIIYVRHLDTHWGTVDKESRILFLRLETLFLRLTEVKNVVRQFIFSLYLINISHN
jgi:hypothetical protein